MSSCCVPETRWLRNRKHLFSHLSLRIRDWTRQTWPRKGWIQTAHVEAEARWLQVVMIGWSGVCGRKDSGGAGRSLWIRDDLCEEMNVS